MTFLALHFPVARVQTSDAYVSYAAELLENRNICMQLENVSITNLGVIELCMCICLDRIHVKTQWHFLHNNE